MRTTEALTASSWCTTSPTRCAAAPHTPKWNGWRAGVRACVCLARPCQVAQRLLVIVMYAVQGSFDHVRHWFGEVTKYATKNTSKLLIGNKIDMVDNIRVSDGEGKVGARARFPKCGVVFWRPYPVAPCRWHWSRGGGEGEAACCPQHFCCVHCDSAWAGVGVRAVHAVSANQCEDVGKC